MRKAGKPNSFLKGMQMDVDPLLQPKESYRYAKNIRLASYVGKNISVQPYDSDRLALALAGGEISTFETGTISDIVNWTTVSETIYNNWSQLTWQSFFTALTNASTGLDFVEYFTYGTLSDNYDISGFPDSSYVMIGEWVTPGEWYDDVSVEMELNGQLLPPFAEGGFYINFYDQFLLDYPTLPLTTVASGVGDSNSDGIGLSFTVTLTLSNEDTETIIVDVPPFAEITDATSNSLYFENIIANQITTADNGFTASITSVSGSNNLWSISSSTEVTVTNVSIVVNGDVVVTTNTDYSAIENQWKNAFNDYMDDSDYSDSYYVREAIGDEFGSYFSDRINWYLSTVSGINGTIAISDFSLLNESADIESGFTTEDLYLSKGMQILGHYAFSDYLVILGTWVEQESITGYPSDFVLKTSQKKDGTLVNVGEEGIYELFFVGNLGFSNKKKLKVVGAEENEHVRRIYFTDGDICGWWSPRKHWSLLCV